MKPEAFSIRLATQPEELISCETLQKEVWGINDLGVTPNHFFIASVHSGGFVAIAYKDKKAIGFLNGFPSYLPKLRNSIGLHSDMMAVLPDYRGLGVGQKLKWFQRDWCLNRGITWMTWTFDPLQAKNAKLNLEYLGVTISEYRINEYGSMGGGLNGDLPTDRFLANWDLTSNHVKQLKKQAKLEPFDLSKLPFALMNHEAAPVNLNLSLDAPYIRVALPESLNDLLKNDVALALEWRLAVREVYGHYFSHGYEVIRYLDETHVLERKSHT